MHIAFYIFIILAIVVFIAGFVDSIAGGGGLLTLPSYLLLGIPPYFALGTNKFVNSMGSGVAIINFIKEKKYTKKIILSGLVFAIVGAVLGTKSVLFIDTNTVGKIITFLLPVGMCAVLIPKKQSKVNHKITNFHIFFLAPIICFILGFYDGFFGPGTGSFLAIAFFSFFHQDLIVATGNAKIFNFTSNIASLITFITAGKIFYSIALPLMFFSMAGNYLGSHMAIKKGNNFIKIFLMVVLIFIFITFIIKYI